MIWPLQRKLNSYSLNSVGIYFSQTEKSQQGESQPEAVVQGDPSRVSAPSLSPGHSDPGYCICGFGQRESPGSSLREESLEGKPLPFWGVAHINSTHNPLTRIETQVHTSLGYVVFCWAAVHPAKISSVIKGKKNMIIKRKQILDSE